MARLATIQSYLIEIRKLHREGDSLATTILAKLLARLDEQLTRAKQRSLHFTRSFSARPVYDADFIYNEFSAVWIAFASYYHTLAFHDNDTLKTNFQVIWASYFKDYCDVAPDICNADFFRKCLIAAELYRRKQYVNYVKKLLSADTIFRYKDQIKSLPSFPLPNDLLPLITERLFISMTSEAHFWVTEAEIIPEALCHFSILNGSIQIYIDRALQFLKKTEQCAPIVALFLEMQSRLSGGIPLTFEQQQMIETNRSLSGVILSSHIRKKEMLNAIMHPPTESDILTSLSTIHTFVKPDQQRKAFAMLDERFIPPDLLPIVIENLLQAAGNPLSYIREAAYDKLRQLPIPEHLNNRVIETLLGKNAQRSMPEYRTNHTPFLGRTIISADMLHMVVDYLLDHIIHCHNLNLGLAAADALINIDMPPALAEHAIRRLINTDGIPSQPHFQRIVKYHHMAPVLHLLQTLFSKLNTSDALKVSVASYIIKSSSLILYCRDITAAFQLLDDITTTQMKGDILSHVTKQLCLLPNDTLTTIVCAKLFDKLTPPTYEARYEVATELLAHMQTNASPHHMVKPLLAFTFSLPFEHQVRMMTLFDKILSDNAFIINDCILGRFKLQEQVNEQVIRPMHAVLPSEMITAIETLAYPRR